MTSPFRDVLTLAEVSGKLFWTLRESDIFGKNLYLVKRVSTRNKGFFGRVFEEFDSHISSRFIFLNKKESGKSDIKKRSWVCAFYLDILLFTCYTIQVNDREKKNIYLILKNLLILARSFHIYQLLQDLFFISTSIARSFTVYAIPFISN